MIHFDDLISDIGDAFSDFVDEIADDIFDDYANDSYVTNIDFDGDGVSHIGLITENGFLPDGFGIDFDGDGNFEITATVDNGVQFDLNDDGINNLSGYDTNGDGQDDYFSIDINGDGRPELELFDENYDGEIDSHNFHKGNTLIAAADLFFGDDDVSFDLPSADDEDPFNPQSYDVDDVDVDITDDIINDVPDDVPENTDITDDDVPTSDEPHDYRLDTNTIPTTDNFTFVAPGTDTNSGVAYDTNGDGVADTYYYDYHGNDGVIDTAGYDLSGDGIIDTIAYDTDGDGKFDTVGYDVDGDNIMDKFAYDEDGDGVFELTGVPGNEEPAVVPDDVVPDDVVPDDVVPDDVVPDDVVPDDVVPDDVVPDDVVPDDVIPDDVIPESDQPSTDVPAYDVKLVAELDTNGDGVTDAWAYDMNGDGTIDNVDMDTDFNGTIDASMRDTDFDGKADVLVLDHNGDSYVDETIDVSARNINIDRDVRDFIENGNQPAPEPEEPDQPMPEEPDKPANDDYQTHDIKHDENMKDIINGATRDYNIGSDKYYADTNGDGKNDVMIRYFDTDGDGQNDTSIQYYDTDHDGSADEMIRTELIDTDGDGVYDTYEESVDYGIDGTFEEVHVYDYDDATGDKDLVNIYYNIDSNDYIIDADWFDATETFDPSESDPNAVIGDPADEMEHWEFQGNTGRCAIYAQKFIIEQYTGQEVDIEELVDKAIEHGWFSESGGTPVIYCDKLLELYGVPCDMSYGNELDDLRSALESGKHVLVGIDADEIWGQDQDDIFSPADGSNHAVDVIGIDYTDPEHPMVILNDSGSPGGCGELVPMDVFMDAWDDSNYRMVVAG